MGVPAAVLSESKFQMDAFHMKEHLFETVPPC